MNQLTMECLVGELANRGGVIASGGHKGDSTACPACALELAAVCRRLDYWTDSPTRVGMPDIRPINDRYRDATRRTAALLPWLVALDGWSQWDESRRVAWARIVALRTVREIVPIALRAVGLEDHAKACESAADLQQAAAASYAAAAAYADYADYAASYAAYAANAAAAAYADYAASYASYAAANAAADTDSVLDLAVTIQIDATRETA